MTLSIQNRLYRRPGAMYVAVLGCTLLVTAIGVSAVMVTRVEGRGVQGSADLVAARHLAQSSIDLGLLTFYALPDWRTSKSQGAWKTKQAAGDGTISLSVADPVDGLLGDAAWEPITFTGTGFVREARYVLENTSIAQPLPLPALNTCLHTAGKVTVNLTKNITVIGAPLSMNGSINGPGLVNGNVEAGSSGSFPNVSGTSNTSSPAKEMPDAGLVAMYRSLATTVSNTSDMDRDVLAPGYNSRGSVNLDGVYYIDASPTGNDFKMKRSRIHGTLVVKVASGKKLILEDIAFLHSSRSDYPVLIVDGNLEFKLNSGSFSESSEGVNLNPTGATYLGISDSDTSDTYPNEARGLVHVTGTLTLSNSSRVNGVILAGGNVTVTGTPQLTHNPSLYANPPMGYVTYAMQLAHGSWHRVITP